MTPLYKVCREYRVMAGCGLVRLWGAITVEGVAWHTVGWHLLLRSCSAAS